MSDPKLSLLGCTPEQAWAAVYGAAFAAMVAQGTNRGYLPTAEDYRYYACRASEIAFMAQQAMDQITPPATPR